MFKLHDFILFEDVKAKSINLRKIVTFCKNGCFFSSLAFVLCISRIQVQVNSNNISNTQDPVSIDAGRDVKLLVRIKFVKTNNINYLFK
jgi:hypothetical protein